MKKKIPKYIIIVMTILLVGISAIVGIKSLSKDKKEEKGSNINFAIMITNDSGDGYKEFRENITWPDINYKINLEKSECLDIEGDKKEDLVTFDHTNWEAVVETDETVYCTLYFDKANPSISVELKEDAGYDNLNLKAKPKDIEGTITKYEFQIGKEMSQLSEWQEGTVNEDRTGEKKFEGLEDGVEYYVKVKVTEIIGKQEKEIEEGPFIFKTRDREPEIVSIESVTNSTPWKAVTVKTTGKKGTREIGSYCYIVKEGTVEKVEEKEWDNAECSSSNLSADKLIHTKEITGLDESTTYTIFVKIEDINKLKSLNTGRLVIKTDATPRPTVSFNNNGGSGCTSKQVKVDDPYGTLCTPTRTGYTFDGWYTSSSGGTRKTSSSIVTNTNNHTLYAHWTANSYTLSYDSNGGSSCSSKSVTFNSSYGTLCSPSRSCYNFDGWYLNGRSITSSSTVNTASSHTLTASWSRKSVTVYFDSAGGSSCSSKSASCGGTYNISCTPTRACYTFAGWYYGSSSVSSGMSLRTNSNHTLTAHWSRNNVTVSYDSAGGSYCSPTTLSCGGTYSGLCTPTRDGYTFEGWYYGGTRVYNGKSLQSNSSHTLTAYWTAIPTPEVPTPEPEVPQPEVPQPDNVTIYYDNNGGSGCGSQSATYGGTYSNLCVPNPPRSCNSFSGWFYGGTRVDNGTPLQSNSSHTLTAHWNANDYTVHYDNAGGKGCYSTTVSCGGTYHGLCTPTRDGYIFDGWYYDGRRVDDGTSLQSNGTHTLIAHWSQKPIRITFNVNGGKLAQSSINNGYGLNSYNYIAYNGETYERWVYPGGNVGSDGLPNYNTEGHINLTRSGKVVEPNKEWYKRKDTSKTLSQAASYASTYTYDYLKKYYLTSEDETDSYYNLYLYVNWRNCNVYNQSCSGGYYYYTTKCNWGGVVSDYIGGFYSCDAICNTLAGGARPQSGTCSYSWIPTGCEDTTCKVYG